MISRLSPSGNLKFPMNFDSSAELGELRAQVARLRAENAALRAQGEELVPMNSRIARLLESQAMGVLIANLDGEIVAINPAFERIIGRTNLHAKYFDWRECVPPEELKRHEEHARILGETGWLRALGNRAAVAPMARACPL